MKKLQQIYLGKATNVNGDERLFRVSRLTLLPDVFKLANPINRVFFLACNDKDAFGGSFPQLTLSFVMHWKGISLQN